MGQARGLGHRDVDDDDKFKCGQRLTHARGVGERMNRVAAFDEQCSIAIWVIGENLVGDDVARQQPADDARPDTGTDPTTRFAAGLATGFAP